jgi:transcriptional regulator with XRE-family HTH domain
MKHRKTAKKKKFLEIEYYRKKYLISQADFAMLLGVKENTYSHKETGISPVSTDELLLIHEALNKSAKKAGDPPITMDALLGM